MLTKLFMETKAEREVVIENKELRDLIIELKAIDSNISEMVKASEEAQQNFDKEVMIRQKIVDKMKPLVNAEFAGQLGEFEVLANVTISDESAKDVDSLEVTVKIVDEVQTFIEKKRKAKEITYAPAEGEVIEEKLAE